MSDDYTTIRREDDRLLASAPSNIAGRIEVRGIGIVEWPAIPEARILLCMDLDLLVQRLPDDMLARREILGVSIPVLPVSALESSAPIKVELAVRGLVDAPHNKTKEH